MANEEIIKKIQAELSPDSKCSLIRLTMAKAVWLKKQSCNDLDLIRLTIKKFNRHLTSGCFCVPRAGVHVAIATTYLEQYFIMLKNCMNNMNDIEKRMKEYQEKMNVKKNLINDIAQNDESGFTCYYNENVNTENFNQLVNILCLAFNSYQKAVDLDKIEKKLTRVFLNKMGRGILENLITLFEIFVYYGMYQFALKTARLSIIVVNSYFNYRNDQEEITIIRCNFVKILLKLGFVDTAKNYYRSYFLHYVFTEENISEITSNSHSQIFLLNCELKLRIAKNSKVIGPLLYAFINGDYMKKSTVKRYIIKTMCFLLASRISCSFYKYDKYFIEFVEPIQLLVGMCRRWKMFQMFFSNNEYIEINDPWSIRFQTLNMFNESLEFFLDFHVNNGLTTDHIFYYKIGVNLFSITLNLLSLSKLQLIAAKYDIMDGYYLDAKFKLTLFKSYFKKCCYNSDLFDKHTNNTSCQTSDPNNDESVILNSLNSLKIDDCSQTNTNESSNNFDKYYQCYKRLIIESRTDQPEDINYDNISLEKYLQKFISDFKHIKLPNDMIITVFYQYLFYIINNLIMFYEETMNTNAITTERYLFILKVFEHITMKIYAESIKKEKISHLSTTIDEQFIHGPFSILFWILSENFIRILIAKRSYEEALPFLHRITKISSHSYSNRVYRSKLYYYQSFVTYKILKQMNLFEKPKMFQMTTFQFMDNEIPRIQDDGERTPTPKVVRNRRIIAKAPVKVSCVSDTAKQYGKSLLNTISQETLEGTRRNVLKFADNDLNINEDDEQLNSSKLFTPNSNSNYDDQAYQNLGIFNDEELLQFLNKCTDISDESLYIDNSVYINFEKNENVKNILKDFTLDNVRAILMRIIHYIGLHPTRDLYLKMQYFLYKLARFTPNAHRYASFHLAETASSHAFRYRLLFTLYKKVEQNKLNFDIEMINFKYDDFINYNYGCTNVLPATWRFVQIKLLENGTKFPHILISRFDSKHSNSFMIKIKNNPEKVTKFFLEEFNEIIKMNNVSILETEKEAFWKLRHEYNQRLKKLLISVEDNIFGIIKGILMGKIIDKKYLYRCREFSKCIKNLSEKMNLTCLNDQLLNVIVESMAILPNEYANIIANVLFNTNNPQFIEEFLQLKKKYFRHWINENELKELFKNIEPVGIIIDPALSQFPFESLPTFRKLNQPYFRIPSLRVANLLYKKHQDIMKTGVDDEKTFYLLNPGNNLDNTEKYFKDSFLSIMDWNGFVGTAPDGTTLKENLETKDIYIYMGHGSGSQYYRTIPHGLDNVNINSLSLVVGCSSGRITSQTKNAGIFGAPYRFLLNGAPAYIGMLWDVTDKDIDIFFNSFMSYWFKRWKSITNTDKINSICQAISQSRDSCKLKYLIGCSPVVYGLPIKNIL